MIGSCWTIRKKARDGRVVRFQRRQFAAGADDAGVTFEMRGRRAVLLLQRGAELLPVDADRQSLASEQSASPRPRKFEPRAGEVGMHLDVDLRVALPADLDGWETKCGGRCRVGTIAYKRSMSPDRGRSAVSH